MPTYRYTALAESGSLVTGESVAVSEEALRRQLQEEGLLAQRIRKRHLFPGFRRANRVRPEEFLLFNQEFAALLRAGLTVPEALRLSSDRPDQPMLSGVLRQIDEEVRRGTAPSEACARHPEVFEGLYIAALKTGEKTGNLVVVLQKYQEALRQRVVLHKKVSQAMAYPLFLLVTLGVILAVLFAFVLPRFVAIYSDFGAELPLATRLLIQAVHGLPYLVPAAVVTGLIGWRVGRRLLGEGSGREWLDGIRERLPVVGAIYQQAAVAQIARTISSLLAGGVPLVEAMRITRDSVANRVRARKLAEATAEVVQGRSLAQAVRATTLMPGNAVKMIEVGEASGGIGEMLAEIATVHEETLSHLLARLMALIEPVLMLLMGILVGGTIIVMYLPVFSIVSVIK
jgi:type IV pilus assembly protein PilC